MQSSLMIQGILDHLVATNRRILNCCKGELYTPTNDFIKLTDISRSSDVIDIKQNVICY